MFELELFGNLDNFSQTAGYIFESFLFVKFIMSLSTAPSHIFLSPLAPRPSASSWLSRTTTECGHKLSPWPHTSHRGSLRFDRTARGAALTIVFSHWLFLSGGILDSLAALHETRAAKKKVWSHAKVKIRMETANQTC